MKRMSTYEMSMFQMLERVNVVEKAFVDFLKMEELEEKFQEYLDGKYKQPEHKQS
jgi:hypothetical protein